MDDVNAVTAVLIASILFCVCLRIAGALNGEEANSLIGQGSCPRPPLGACVADRTTTGTIEAMCRCGREKGLQPSNGFKPPETLWTNWLKQQRTSCGTRAFKAWMMRGPTAQARKKHNSP
jgi:hypothetical protein